ncbi:hypothetical protein [Dysgonomonas mossii]|uniref:hypothetical protein n=1 Tax=Dysgonomonas mossii TaxID=163665 RepID=UPI003993B909
MKKITANKHLTDIVSDIYRLQANITKYIDLNESSKEIRVRDDIDSLISINDNLSDATGKIGDMIGGLIIDQVYEHFKAEKQ